MKGLAVFFIVVAIASVVVGVVLRIINFYPYNIQPLSFLFFANTLLLLAISFCVLRLLKSKQ